MLSLEKRLKVTEDDMEMATAKLKTGQEDLEAAEKKANDVRKFPTFIKHYGYITFAYGLKVRIIYIQAEQEASALNKKIGNLEEELESAIEKSQITQQKQEDAEKAADESERYVDVCFFVSFR